MIDPPMPADIRGSEGPYRRATFYCDEDPKRPAKPSLAALIQSGRFVRRTVSAIAPLTDHCPAEAGRHPTPAGMDTWRRSVLKNYFSVAGSVFL